MEVRLKCWGCGGSGMRPMATISLAIPPKERRKLDQYAEDNKVPCLVCNGSGFADKNG